LRHLVGLDAALCKEATFALFPLRGLVPGGVQPADIRSRQRQFQLPFAWDPGQQNVVDDGFHDLFGIDRYRDSDAEALADRCRLANQYVEDDLIDLVVGAVQQHRADFSLRLAETIDAPLPLLEPVGVPRQVIMDDGVEMLLQVDALGEAVGRNEDPPQARRKLADFLLAFVVADIAGDRLDMQVF